MGVLTKEIVKKVLKGQSCKSCYYCRGLNDNNYGEDMSKYAYDIYKNRLKTFAGRQFICIGADRNTQSLDKRGWCEKWKPKPKSKWLR